MTLLQCLAEEVGGGSRAWSDLLIVMNKGLIHPTWPLGADQVSSRGFNVVLLGPRHLPSHVLKVRPISNAAFDKEAKIHSLLCKHPSSKMLVPSAKVFLCGPMRVLASKFVRGESLASLIRKRRLGDGWSGPIGDALAASFSFWKALGTLFGRPEGGVMSATLEKISDDLATLRKGGLSQRTFQIFNEHLESIWLPSRPQHGDLWSNNLLRMRDGWCILDFEDCGEIDLPLFDVFQLIRSSLQAFDGRGPGSWLEQWARLNPPSGVLNRSVRRHAEGLSREQIEAALMAYLVSVTARMVRRGLPMDITAAGFREIEMAPELSRRFLVSIPFT